MKWWTGAAALLLLVALASKSRGQFVFNVFPEDTVLIEGDTLNLTCEAVFIASPSNTLSYAWSKNDTILSNISRLVIESVNVSDQGNYTCTIHMGHLTEERTVEVRVQAITDGLKVETVIMISLLSALGVIAIVIIGLVLFIRYSVCRDKSGRTWNDIHHSLVKQKEQSSRGDLLISGNNLLRSKSLGELLSGDLTFDDPYDRNLSVSTEQLLSGAENTTHPSNNMDFDLQLDERIFDAKKSSSDTNLCDTLVHEKQQDLDYKRKHSDPHPTAGVKSILSQRTPSLGSSFASDFGEELSDTSSTLKSVRFDLDDSGMSSDHPSPRHLLARRSSAPEVKYTKEQFPQKLKLETKEMDDGIDEGLGSEHRLDSENNLPSNNQSDTNAKNLPIQHRVSQMKVHFQQEVKNETTPIESRQRAHSISRRVSETTKLLMESKSETTTPVTMTTPRKIVGLDPAVGIPKVLSDEDLEEPEVDTEFELFEKSRKSGLALPFFGGPLSLSPWQPPTSDLDNDVDDEVLVGPIKASGGMSSVSPLHRSVFGGRFLQLGLMEGHEMFTRHTPSRTPSRKSSASRLTAIPEESPQGSTVDVT